MFVELPEVGTAVSKGGSFGAVESVKATSDVNSPISGEVVEANTKLTENPGHVCRHTHKTVLQFSVFSGKNYSNVLN